jgi:hypothetical protein
MAWFGVAAAKEGRPEEARRILDSLEQLRRTQYVDAVMVLELCTALRDQQAVHLWLQRGIDERSTQVVYLPLHKAWLGGDAEAEAMVAKSR